MLASVWVVAGKEMRDNLRDRRSVLSALIYPLLGPLVFALLLHTLGTTLFQPQSARFPLPVAGAEHAPALMRFLDQEGIVPLPAPADPEAAVAQRLVRVVLVIDHSFAADLAAGRQATARVVSDASTLQGELLANRLASTLQQFGRVVAEDRLAAQGLDRKIADPIRIVNVISTVRRSLADMFLHMIPPFLIFTLFIGSVYLSIDVTAGERERGSLEPLLAMPVPRWQVLLGKYTAAMLFTGFALALQLLCFYLVFQSVESDRFSNGVGLSVSTIALIFLISLPVMALAVAIQIIVAALTRSFKEALTWLGVLPILPGAPGLLMAFFPVAGEGWMAALPVFAQIVEYGQILRGDMPAVGHLLTGAAVTLLAAGLMLRYAARLFGKETIIFP